MNDLVEGQPVEPQSETQNEPKKIEMKRKPLILAAIAVVVLAGASLFYFLYLQNPSRQVLARVNDDKITVEQFNKELAKVEPALIREMLREEPNNLLEKMIVKTLLLQEAKKQGVSAPVKTYKDVATNPLPADESIIAEFFGKKFPSPPEVTHEEVEGFYKMYKNRMEGKSLKEVAPAIEQYIREAKSREIVAQFLEEIRKNAKVEVSQAQLQKIVTKPPEMNTEEELKQALASGKPVLVDFGANSCLPCRQMRPILKEIANEYSEKARILAIDVYKYQNLAKEYRVLMLPTLVFFDSKGKETFRTVGLMEKEKIVGKLKEIGMGT
ncbi:MAG TPA: thioredoxin domain-containing protein [Thermodesulfobacteriota bacterium]|nr:thioredoxin domain-containing protein [Thermodesulfobacteriota bacterium]